MAKTKETKNYSISERKNGVGVAGLIGDDDTKMVRLKNKNGSVCRGKDFQSVVVDSSFTITKNKSKNPKKDSFNLSISSCFISQLMKYK